MSPLGSGRVPLWDHAVQRAYLRPTASVCLLSRGEARRLQCLGTGVTRTADSLPDLDELLETLHPICYLGGDRPELYRNRRELKRALNRIIPSLVVPADEPQY